MTFPAHVIDQLVSACREDGVDSKAVAYAHGLLAIIHDNLCQGQPARGHVHFDQLSEWLQERIAEERQVFEALKAAGL